MAETFGKTTVGTQYESSANYIRGCKFQSGSAGNLQSISLWVKQSGAGTPKVKCAIYKAADNGLLANATTEEKTVQNGQDGWMVFDFPIRPTVLATTDYFLVLWQDGTLIASRDVGDPLQYRYESINYDGWPGSLGGFSSAYVMSIYATYYEAPAKKTLVQVALISIPPLIVLPTLGQILKLTGGC